MRPQFLLVTLAVLAVAAALPLLSNGSGEEEGGAVNLVDGEEEGGAVDAMNRRAWPCCDQCGGCNESWPQVCQCMDISFQGCHPRCMNCVKYMSRREPPIYRCADNLTTFCRRRCTHADRGGHMNE